MAGRRPGQPPYYDRELVQRAFMMSRIQEQGEVLLFRALNIGQAVGFVGSGVGSAYGRPTWAALINDAQTQMEEAIRHAKPTRNEMRDSLHKLNTLSATGASDPDLLPLRAHLVRALWDQDGTPPDGPDKLESCIKEAVRFDDGVVEAAWSAFLPERSSFAAGSIPDFRTLARRADTSGGLKVVLETIAANVPPAAALVDQVRVALQLESPNSLHLRLSAEERWLAPLLHVAALHFGALDAVKDKLAEYCGAFTAELDGDATRSPTFDPARQILDGLKLHRILTTNYDFELERALERMGFDEDHLRPSGHGAAPRPSADGALTAGRPRGDIARSLVLKRDTAAELTGLAVRGGGADYSIFHLHGRALDGPDERLVITERDYQEVYLRDTPEQHVMEEALSATMAGNPIIFLGMGMLEADILRPLRRFVSSREGQSNRSLVALMPSEQPYGERVAAALQLHLRYGVHTIFYGTGNEDAGAAGPEDETPEPALYRSVLRVRELRAALQGKAVGADSMLAGGSAAELLEPIAWEAFAPRRRDPITGATSTHDPLMLAVKRLAVALLKDGDDVTPSRAEYSDFLKELDSRIRTRALCHRLDGLIQARREWWSDWRILPSARVYTHKFRCWAGGAWRDLQVGEDAYDSSLVIRSERFAPAAGESRTFPKAIIDRVKQILDLHTGPAPRRVFVVSGETGSGRGSFLRALAEDFAKSSQENGSGSVPRYGWGVFTSTTFSQEYGSVIAATRAFFDKTAEAVHAEAPSTADALLDAVRSGGARQGRGIIAIGDVDALFRANGTAKNRDVHAYISSLLVEDGGGDLALDIVFTCSKAKVDAIFGSTSKAPSEAKQATRDGKAVFGKRTQPLIGREDKHIAARTPVNATEEFDVTRIDLRGGDALFTDTESRYAEVLKELGSQAQIHVEWGDAKRLLTPRFQASIVIACVVHLQTSQGSDCAQAFLDTLIDTASRADDRLHRDVVLNEVLRAYLPTAADRAQIAEQRLTEAVLKHLSIMSMPVEDHVLSRCPELTALEDVAKGATKNAYTIAAALESLSNRKLVFKVVGRPEAHGGGVRYAVHRSLQGYFFRKMGSPHLEFGDSRLFTVSVFGSQRADLPALNPMVYVFLRDLVRGLIGYPPETPEKELDPEQHLKQVCALRAALGIVRASLNCAVVSRYAADAAAKPPYGVMEELRLLLRWMIYRAGRLGEENAVSSGTRSPLQAFYPEEIVWVYNECGLASLIGGNLYDAGALLRQAREMNTLCEIGPKSPNSLRIRFNQAVVQLERGQLARADDGLRALSRDADAESEAVIWALARGMHGLVAHLKGRRVQAEKCYEEALQVLRSIDGEARAVAMFSRHFGDLMRPFNPARSKRLLDEALAEAETARQHAETHRVHVSRINSRLNDPAPLGSEEARHLMRRLADVVSYADQMELNGLKVDALTSRARVIQRQGELGAAGRAAVTALALANLLGQRLRTITALAVFGGIMRQRGGYQESARRLLQQARDMAEAADHQGVLQHVDEQLMRLG